MPTTRQEKVARLIQRELNIQFLQLAKDQSSLVMISVTVVRISPDLSHAKAFVSIFPTEKIEETLEFLQGHMKTIRYELGKKVRHQLRIVPHITLHLDDSLDYAEHIDELLRK